MRPRVESVFDTPGRFCHKALAKSGNWSYQCGVGFEGQLSCRSKGYWEVIGRVFIVSVRFPVLLLVCWLHSYQVYCRVCGYCLGTLPCPGPHGVMSAGMGASHTLLESEETKPMELVRVTQPRVRVGCPRWAPGPNTGHSVGSQAALCLPRWSPEDLSMWEIEDK